MGHFYNTISITKRFNCVNLYVCFKIVPAEWTEWGNWTLCSETCGTGIRTKQRQCKPPRNNGTACGAPVLPGHKLIYTETVEGICDTGVACPGNFYYYYY